MKRILRPEQGWRWLADETGLSGGLRALVVPPPLSPRLQMCALKAASLPETPKCAHTHKLSLTHTHMASALHLPHPGRTVGTSLCSASTFPAAPAPRSTRATTPSPGALQRDTSFSGPLTSHRQLLAGSGADRGGSGDG